MRKLYVFAILMAMSVAVNAQTKERKTISGDCFVVPKLFTYGDNMYVDDIIKINGKIYITMGNGGETVFFKVDRQATSITLVAAMPVSAKSIFSLSGQKLSSAQRGVNIVRNSDGSSTKFVKKKI